MFKNVISGIFYVLPLLLAALAQASREYNLILTKVRFGKCNRFRTDAHVKQNTAQLSASADLEKMQTKQKYLAFPQCRFYSTSQSTTLSWLNTCKCGPDLIYAQLQCDEGQFPMAQLLTHHSFIPGCWS